MKFVKILINNIFIPFATFLFILVGVFAALLSAIIEFAVLKELFTSEYQEFIPSFLIALALVLLLEYSKLYLHYLLGRWKHKPDSNSAKYMKKVRIIVSIPIAISFVCTVIFSVTTLDKASYNENAFQTEKARIENQLKTDIQDGKVDWNAVPFTTVNDPEAYLLKTGDIVFARTGATVGKSFLITETPYPSVYASYLIRIRLLGSLSPEYIYQFFDSACYWSQITDKSVGVGQPNCNGTSLKELFIPLPPISEQLRIVPTAQALLAYVAKIDAEKKSLLSIIMATKSKILDLAIRGQLIPQDPNDEPASVLLERIRAEKEELIKQGKIKRDKKESVIFRGEDNSYYEKIGTEVYCIDEEIPFDIPDTWEWMRLESCCIKEIRRGKSPKYIDESGTLVFAQKCNTRYSGIDVGLALFLDENTLGRYPDDEYMQDGDVVINSTGTGTLGRVGIYHATDNYLGLPIVPDSHVTIIRAARSIQSVYLYGFMKANQSELEKEGEGSTNQKELKPLTLKEMLIPIPPYSEQERIVATITAAFSTISAIENSLN